MKKLLVFGASGLTGYKIAHKGASNYDITASYNTRKVETNSFSIKQCNVTKFDQVKEIFSTVQPDIVINTTALHNVDYCEENSEDAFLVNDKAVQNLAKECKNIGAKFLHISTDYVFEGKNDQKYSEEDPANPVSVYGESKLSGEHEVLKISGVAVLRPSVVYGWTPMELAGTVSSSGKPMNFAMWLLTKLHNNESLKIVTDQFATATLADSLAESALKIVESDKGGLYHVSGLSCESRYDFSVKLAKEFGYDTDLISKTDSSQFKQKAKRPSYSCLGCDKVIKEFGLELYTTEKALKIMKEQVAEEAPNLLGK